MAEDHYALLGVARGATAEEVVAASRARRAELEDARGWITEQELRDKLQALEQASACLTSPTLRAAYDEDHPAPRGPEAPARTQEGPRRRRSGLSREERGLLEKALARLDGQLAWRHDDEGDEDFDDVYECHAGMVSRRLWVRRHPTLSVEHLEELGERCCRLRLAREKAGRATPEVHVFLLVGRSARDPRALLDRLAVFNENFVLSLGPRTASYAACLCGLTRDAQVLHPGTGDLVPPLGALKLPFLTDPAWLERELARHASTVHAKTVLVVTGNEGLRGYLRFTADAAGAAVASAASPDSVREALAGGKVAVAVACVEPEREELARALVSEVEALPAQAPRPVLLVAAPPPPATVPSWLLDRRPHAVVPAGWTGASLLEAAEAARGAFAAEVRRAGLEVALDACVGEVDAVAAGSAPPASAGDADVGPAAAAAAEPGRTLVLVGAPSGPLAERLGAAVARSASWRLVGVEDWPAFWRAVGAGGVDAVLVAATCPDELWGQVASYLRHNAAAACGGRVAVLTLDGLEAVEARALAAGFPRVLDARGGPAALSAAVRGLFGGAPVH